MWLSIIKLLLLVLGAAGVVGGPYILYLVYRRPEIFAKPALAKTQGAVASVVGVVLVVILIVLLKQ